MPTQQQIQQSNLFQQEYTKELTQQHLPWSPDLRKWHSIAMKALNVSSLDQLNVPENYYPNLFDVSDNGIRADVFSLLAQNMVKVVPADLNMTAGEWRAVMRLNYELSMEWDKIAQPIIETVSKRVQMMSAAKPGLIQLAQA